MTHWLGSTLNIKHHEQIKMLLMKWTLVVVDCYGRWLDFQPPLWASWWYWWLLDIDECWPGSCLAARFLSITLWLLTRHAESPSHVTWLETPEAPFPALSQSPGIMVYGERNWPINLFQNDRSPRRPPNVAARNPFSEVVTCTHRIKILEKILQV